MADAFSVDPEALADVVAQMAEFQQYAESMLAEIDNLVTGLHVTWTGLGAQAHGQAHRHWARGQAMMREGLAQLQTAGATAHGNYSGVMAKNQGMWS